MSERSAVILDGPLLIYRHSDAVVMQRRRVDLRTVCYLESSSLLESSSPEHYLFLYGNGWMRTISVTSREQVETISKAWDEVRKGLGPQELEIHEVECDPTAFLRTEGAKDAIRGVIREYHESATVPQKEVTPCGPS